MRLVSTHYWVTFYDEPLTQHIREIGDTYHTYCNASIAREWHSDNLRMDVALEQVCPVCFSLYSLGRS
jgi:hypothetical protein